MRFKEYLKEQEKKEQSTSKSVLKIRELLEEYMFKIDNDVDYIYKELGFKNLVDSFTSITELQGYDDFLVDYHNDIGKEQVSSSELKSSDSVKAHNILPCEIKNDVIVDTNKYFSYGINDKYGRHSSIILGVERETINKLNMYLDNINNENYKPLLKLVKREISEETIKANISHELTHWLEDALYREKIFKNIKKRKGLDVTRHEVTSSHEIESVLQAIKQVKRRYQYQWEDMSFLDLINKSDNLDSYLTLVNKLPPEEVKEYVKNLVVRGMRESLFSKKMLDDVKSRYLINWDYYRDFR